MLLQAKQGKRLILLCYQCVMELLRELALLQGAEPLAGLVLMETFLTLPFKWPRSPHQFSSSRTAVGLILWPSNRFDLVWTFKLLKFCLRDSSHPLITYCLMFLCLSTLAYSVCFLCLCTSSTLWLLRGFRSRILGKLLCMFIEIVIAASPYLSMHRELEQLHYSSIFLSHGLFLKKKIIQLLFIIFL